MSASENLSLQALSYYFTTDAVDARPTTWNVSLHSGDPGPLGADNRITVADDANYADQSATFASSDQGDYYRVANTAAINFPVAATAYSATHAVIRDAATDDPLAIVTLNAPVDVAVAGAITLAASSLYVEMT